MAASFCRVQPRPFSFAPLLGRPPGGSLVGALKRIVFSPPHRCHLSPQGFHWCLPLRGRRRKGTPAAAYD